MTVTFFLVVVLLLGFARSTDVVVFSQVVFCLFGGAAAVLLPALGGATITPAVLFLPFTLVRALRSNGAVRLLRNINLEDGGVWLALAVGIGVIGAIAWPRLLPDSIQIMTIDRETVSERTIMVPIRPVSGNLTQSAYAIGNLLAFVSFRGLFTSKVSAKLFRDAVTTLSVLNCVAAVIGLAEFYLHLPSVLEYVRNAGYTTYGHYELGGLVRIQGTFPEASMFAAFSVPLFAFNLQLWLDGECTRRTGALAAVLLALLLLSTSTTAYFGLAVYLSFRAAKASYGVITRRRLSKAIVIFAVGWFVLVVIVSVVVFAPSVFDKVNQFLNVTLFEKLNSSSGEDRSSMNRAAWANFVDTFGLGVGLGSARASSFILVMLSNFGLLGSVAYLLFIRRVLAPTERSSMSNVQRASAQAVLAGLITSCAGWSIFDLGVAFYAFAAAATVVPMVGVNVQIASLPPERTALSSRWLALGARKKMATQ